MSMAALWVGSCGSLALQIGTEALPAGVHKRATNIISRRMVLGRPGRGEAAEQGTCGAVGLSAAPRGETHEKVALRVRAPGRQALAHHAHQAALAGLLRHPDDAAAKRGLQRDASALDE